jgi:hypothetical protein
LENPKNLKTAGNFCLSYLPSGNFGVKPCNKQFQTFCGLTTSKLTDKLKLCDRTNHLTVSGVYTKSACEVQKPSTYDDAEKICRHFGMELFVIDVDNQLAPFTMSRKDLGKVFWINGRKAGFGQWFSYSNQQQSPIFVGLSWSGYRSQGKCLSVVVNEKQFIATPKDCEEAHNFYCEYHKVH